MSRIVIQLLDSTKGHALQTWTFDNRATVTIGRAPDNDVELADPYVSRAHAYLQCTSDGWRLMAISQQGLRYKGRSCRELAIVDDAECQLGPHGCLIRIKQADEPTNSQTLSFDETQVPVLMLDCEKLRQEVNQIAEADYFEALKHAARQRREQGLAS